MSDPALSAVFETLPSAAFIVNGAPLRKGSALTSVGAVLYFTPALSFSAKIRRRVRQWLADPRWNWHVALHVVRLRITGGPVTGTPLPV